MAIRRKQTGQVVIRRVRRPSAGSLFVSQQVEDTTPKEVHVDRFDAARAAGANRKQTLLDKMRERSKALRMKVPGQAGQGQEPAREGAPRRTMDALRHQAGKKGGPPLRLNRIAGESGAEPLRSTTTEMSRAVQGRLVDILRERAAARRG